MSRWSGGSVGRPIALRGVARPPSWVSGGAAGGAARPSAINRDDEAPPRPKREKRAGGMITGGTRSLASVWRRSEIVDDVEFVDGEWGDGEGEGESGGDNLIGGKGR